jgi:hypothetical protein
MVPQRFGGRAKRHLLGVSRLASFFHSVFQTGTRMLEIVVPVDWKMFGAVKNLPGRKSTITMVLKKFWKARQTFDGLSRDPVMVLKRVQPRVIGLDAIRQSQATGRTV